MINLPGFDQIWFLSLGGIIVQYDLIDVHFKELEYSLTMADPKHQTYTGLDV